MQGVSLAVPALPPQQALNDENSAAAALPHAGAAPHKPAAAGSALKPPGRRAFGNITNNAPPRGEASAAKPGLMLPPRRALGDLTNSAAKPPAAGAAAAKPAPRSTLKPQPPPAPQPAAAPSSSSSAAQAAATAAAAAAAAATARWQADLEPERPAGKTWQQLEAERWAAQEAEAAASADAIMAAVRRSMRGLLAAPDPGSESDDDGCWQCLHPPAASFGGARGPPSPPLPELSLDDLIPSSSTDLGAWLPDIPLPPDGADEAQGQQEQQQQDEPPPAGGLAGALEQLQLHAGAAGSSDACRGSPQQPCRTATDARGSGSMHSPGEALPW